MSKPSMSSEKAATMVSIGERLKMFRKRAGLSLREAAPLVGVSAMAMSNWERGKVALTSAHLIEAARVYGCKPTDLMYVKPKATLTMVHWHRERI